MNRIVRICFVVSIIVKGHIAIAQIPVITTNPKDTGVCAGADVTLSVTATNNPTGYIWQSIYYPVQNTWNNIEITGPAYTGATTNQLIIHSSALAGDRRLGGGLRLRCIAINADGSSDPSATAVVKIAQPQPTFYIEGPTTVCKGNNGYYFETHMNLNVD